MRLFVSADVDELADGIAAIQEPLMNASGLRLTDPEQAHVTLKFLGDTPEDRLPELTGAIESAVADSGVSPFPAELSNLGVFPDLDYISVVWLGVSEGSQQLTRLHQQLEEQTTALGFDPEDHEFTPHVTLARMDHAGGKELVQTIVQNREPTAGRLTVDAVCLTESRLTPDGPVYQTVKRFELRE